MKKISLAAVLASNTTLTEQARLRLTKTIAECEKGIKEGIGIELLARKNQAHADKIIETNLKTARCAFEKELGTSQKRGKGNGAGLGKNASYQAWLVWGKEKFNWSETTMGLRSDIKKLQAERADSRRRATQARTAGSSFTAADAEQVRREHTQRKREEQAKKKGEDPLPPPASTEFILTQQYIEDATEVITAGYRALSMKYHTDIAGASGSTEKMQRINHAVSGLRKYIERVTGTLNEWKTERANTTKTA